MHYKIKTNILILLAISFVAKAQTKEYGTWSNIKVEKRLGKWDLEAEGELRSRDFLQQVNRLGFKLELSHSFNKSFKLGGSYEYLYFYDAKYVDYQPRQRYNFFIQGKQQFGRFSFSLRERIQRTIKDESDRIRENGSYDSYRINPEWTWRNRLKLEYNVPKLPLKPSFSFETFYQLNNPDGNSFDKLRYTISLSCKINKHHTFEIYGLADKEINVDSPVLTYISGIGYTFSF